MLRFAQRPDPVFLAILHDALEDLQETLTDADGGFWPAQYPTAARCFSSESAQAATGQSHKQRRGSNARTRATFPQNLGGHGRWAERASAVGAVSQGEQS